MAVKGVEGYGVPTMPLGSGEGVAIVGCGTCRIVIDSSFAAPWGAGNELSWTLNFGVTDCCVVGVPLISPAGLRVRPFGRAGEPVTRLHVYAGFPPDKAN